MLKEQNNYRVDLPISVVVAEIYNYPLHFHDDIELVYVLDGSISLKNGCYTDVLTAGDVFILNGKEIHSFDRNQNKNMVLMLRLSTDYFSRYYPGIEDSFFVAHGHYDDKEKLDVLKGIVTGIMLTILQKGQGYEDRIIEMCHNLLSCLISDFQYFSIEDGKFTNDGKAKTNKVLASRLVRITKYMYENYSRKLTLSEIAKREHLSIYYLSHVIRDATGLSFQDLLGFIRVEESEKLLLGTNKKIGHIAEEVGFSAIRYYIKHFEHWFSMHPQEYRNKYRGQIKSSDHNASYTLSSPAEIERALRRQNHEGVSSFSSEQVKEPVIVDLDIFKAFSSSQAIDFMPDIGTSEDVAKAILRPYNIFRSLNERVLYAQPGCIISTSAKEFNELASLSILVYDFNPEVLRAIEEAPSKEEVLDIIRGYDEEVETLVRCSAFSGDFRLARYKMTKENVVSSYEEILRPQMMTSKRQAIRNSWRSLPNVEFSQLSVSDIFTLRTTLKGLSAELIFVDKA